MTMNLKALMFVVMILSSCVHGVLRAPNNWAQHQILIGIWFQPWSDPAKCGQNNITHGTRIRIHLLASNETGQN